MLITARGSASEQLTATDLNNLVVDALDKLGRKKRVLAVPPDFTRYHSQAGFLTQIIWRYYGAALADVLPATGTHFPMSQEELLSMFGNVPLRLFRTHDWRKGCVTLGEVPAEFIRSVSGGMVDYAIPLQIDRLLKEGRHDLILSTGQVVPHEVIGMANYNKNILIGTGGPEGINRTHFLGAAYGIERILGRADTPVRRVLNYGSEHFLKDIPIIYVLTVVGKDDRGKLVVRGLYIGDDAECFELAAKLSLEINFEMLDEPLKKVVVYLDPSEFKSTWLGNKSIYRTRMAIADGGELIVLAPGLGQFGEDPGIDALIRKYGYVGTPSVLDLVKKNEDLQQSLGAAAHLIHGSSEGRFTITYCPGKISRKEMESVNFGYADVGTMMQKYPPATLRDGFNTMPDGEKVFFISNPALGLWASSGRFRD